MLRLCECGCGKPAPVNDRSRTTLGQVKGQQRRFIQGHNRPKLTVEEKRLRKIASNEKNKASGYTKWWHLQRAFHLTKETFTALWEKQKGICPVCHKTLVSDFVVDHDRACCPTMKSCGKCVRGILHRKCNAALGMLDDSPDALRNAAAYLERVLL